jgi:hypothetical protein
LIAYAMRLESCCKGLWREPPPGLGAVETQGCVLVALSLAIYRSRMDKLELYGLQWSGFDRITGNLGHPKSGWL